MISQRDLAAGFSALGDETRLAIMQRLLRGERLSITRISTGAGISRQAVTKHLRVLEEAALVQSEARGRERLYALRRDRVAELQEYLETVTRQWEDALGRLRAHLEDGEKGAR